MDILLKLVNKWGHILINNSTMNDNYFDEQEYENLRKENDYEGMIRMLSAQRAKTIEDQLEVNREISKLKNLESLESAILNHTANEEDRSTYNFYKRISQGYINPWGETGYEKDKEYFDLYTNLGNNGNKEARTFGIAFSTRDDYAKFLENLNVSEDNLENYGLRTNTQNGRFVVNFDKSNNRYINIVNSIVKTAGDINAERTKKVLDNWYNYIPGVQLYKNIAGLFSDSSAQSAKVDRERIADFIKDPFEISVYDSDGNLMHPEFLDAVGNIKDNVLNPITGVTTVQYGLLNPTVGPQVAYHSANQLIDRAQGNDTSYFLDKFKQLYDIQKNAEETYNNVRNAALNKSFMAKGVVSEYMDARHAQLDGLHKAGRLTDQQYKNYVSELEERIKNYINGVGFSQYEIWSADSGDTYLPIEDNAERGELFDVISNANRENRLKILAANFGGMTGSLLIIQAKADSKGNAPEGDFDKGRRLFIPGFINTDAENGIQFSLSNQAEIQFNQHRAYSYPYNFEYSPTKITGFDNADYRYVDKNGNEQIVDENIVRQMIQDDLWTKKITSELPLATLKPDGTLDMNQFNTLLDASIYDYIKTYYGEFLTNGLYSTKRMELMESVERAFNNTNYK